MKGLQHDLMNLVSSKMMLRDEILIVVDAFPISPTATSSHISSDHFSRKYVECVSRIGYYGVQGTTQEFAALTWQECQAKCQAWSSCAGWRWTHNYHPSAKRMCTLGNELGSSWSAAQDSVFCAGTHCLDCSAFYALEYLNEATCV